MVHLVFYKRVQLSEGVLIGLVFATLIASNIRDAFVTTTHKAEYENFPASKQKIGVSQKLCRKNE
jgi:hypothetical protein